MLLFSKTIIGTVDMRDTESLESHFRGVVNRGEKGEGKHHPRRGKAKKISRVKGECCSAACRLSEIAMIALNAAPVVGKQRKNNRSIFFAGFLAKILKKKKQETTNRTRNVYTSFTLATVVATTPHDIPKHNMDIAPTTRFSIWTRLSRREVRASRRLYAGSGSCLRGLRRAWKI